jgi:hypothetical protein
MGGGHGVNNKQRKTLRAIFAQPTRADVLWADIESLFKALGGEIREGRGSRVRVYLNDTVAVFHRPHPQPTTNKGAVESVREFIIRSGVRIPPSEANK